MSRSGLHPHPPLFYRRAVAGCPLDLARAGDAYPHGVLFVLHRERLVSHTEPFLVFCRTQTASGMWAALPREPRVRRTKRSLRVACMRYATTQIMLPIPQVLSTSIPDDRQPLGKVYHAALSQSHLSPQERFRRSNTARPAGSPGARTLSCIMHSASQRRSVPQRWESADVDKYMIYPAISHASLYLRL